MSDKMPETTKGIIVNMALIAGLIWCYFRGYPLTVILITGLVLLVLANVMMYFKRR